MNVADYYLKMLVEAGVKRAFVVYGAANGDLIDAFTRNKDIEYVCAIHEQAAGFMAEATAKVDDDSTPGVAIATSGPGGHNFVTAIANCFYDSVPAIFITGQVSSAYMRRDSQMRQVGFQETPICDIVRPIVKAAFQPKTAMAAYRALRDALHICKDGRAGPVLIDLSLDVQKMVCDFELLLPAIISAGWVQETDAVERSAFVEEYLTDFWQARRPVLLIGGGVRDRYQLDALAGALNIPIFPTWNALDVIHSGHPNYGGRIGTYGGPGRNFAIQTSDLLLSIGCRVSGRITGGDPTSFAKEAKRYLVDVDTALVDPDNQEQMFHRNLLCDASKFIKLLRARYYSKCSVMASAPVPPPDRTAWNALVVEWRERYDPVKAEYFSGPDIHPYVFSRLLSEVAAPDAVVITDCGGNVVAMNHAFKTKGGQRYFSNNGNSPMGFAFAASIGAALADPKRQVICVIGDGGMNVNIQELQTVKILEERLRNLKVFVLNNHAYGITRAYQKTNFEGREEACVAGKGYEPPDFVEVTKAYRLRSFRFSGGAEEGGSLIADIRMVLRQQEFMLLDVDCGDHHQYEPRVVGWSTPIHELTPALPLVEHQEQLHRAEEVSR